MKKLLLNYPTLWNMKNFILISLNISLILNLLIIIFYNISYLIPLLYIASFIGIFYLIGTSENEKKYEINDYDIFDKIKLSPFKEYLIVFIIFLTFFISTISIIIIVKEDTNFNKIKVEILDSNKSFNILNFKEVNGTIKYTEKKEEHNLTKQEKNYLDNFNISKTDSGFSLRMIQQKYIFSQEYIEYIISLFIIIIPLIILSDSSNKPKYRAKSLLTSFYLLFVILDILTYFLIYKKANMPDYFFKTLNFINDYRYWFLFLATLFTYTIWGHYRSNKNGWNNLKTNVDGSISATLLGIVLYFILFNFVFKINILLSTFLMVLISLTIIKPLKEMSLVYKLKAKDDFNDK